MFFISTFCGFVSRYSAKLIVFLLFVLISRPAISQGLNESYRDQVREQDEENRICKYDYETAQFKYILGGGGRVKLYSNNAVRRIKYYWIQGEYRCEVKTPDWHTFEKVIVEEGRYDQRIERQLVIEGNQLVYYFREGWHNNPGDTKRLIIGEWLEEEDRPIKPRTRSACYPWHSIKCLNLEPR